MAARPPAYANVIANALVERLKTINRAGGGVDKWLTSPKTVRRGMLAGDIKAEKPALFVQIARWGDDNQLPGHKHENVITLNVHCISTASVTGDSSEAAEVELNDLASDVIYAVANDEDLVNASGGFQVDDMVIKYYEPQVDAMISTGLGITTVVIDAHYHWEHGAP